ncbi:MAG: chemotaxis protein CheW [Myxococcota bacterium]
MSGADTYLTFHLHEEIFGLEITRVREIVEYDRAVTRVPRTPAFMRGVMNLRGNVVPVVDMNRKLGFAERDPTADTCVIIIEIDVGEETMTVGAMVDGVEEVLELAPEDILEAPPAGTLLAPELLSGLARREEGFVMLMRVEAILAPGELAGVEPPPEAQTRT